MTQLEETLIYDALAEMRRNSVVLCELVNRYGGDAQKEAYVGGVYAPAMKLEVLLGQDALDRGRKRHEKIEADCAAFFAARSKDVTTPALSGNEKGSTK